MLLFLYFVYMYTNLVVEILFIIITTSESLTSTHHAHLTTSHFPFSES